VNSMTHDGYKAIIAYNHADEIFSGQLAGIRPVVTFRADNVADLKAAFREAVEDHRVWCAKVGAKPEHFRSGNLRLRIDPAIHAKAVRAAELAGTSLNKWGGEALSLAAGIGSPT
jgi:predicted HicB family RNase H-like nuclease